MVWTEIITEDVGVTHVGEQHVVFPVGSPSEYEVREAIECVQQQYVWENYVEQMKELKEDIEQQQRAAEQLEGTKYEGLL